MKKKEELQIILLFLLKSSEMSNLFTLLSRQRTSRPRSNDKHSFLHEKKEPVGLPFTYHKTYVSYGSIAIRLMSVISSLTLTTAGAKVYRL